VQLSYHPVGCVKIARFEFGEEAGIVGKVGRTKMVWIATVNAGLCKSAKQLRIKWTRRHRKPPGIAAQSPPSGFRVGAVELSFCHRAK
jgi:hypothetical protein